MKPASFRVRFRSSLFELRICSWQRRQSSLSAAPTSLALMPPAQHGSQGPALPAVSINHEMRESSERLREALTNRNANA